MDSGKALKQLRRLKELKPIDLKGKHAYFASDFHLGAPTHSKSLERERKLISWLETISKDAGAIFIVGDIFDFWFEYKRVVPKGFTRLLGKLAELSDTGLPIIVFAGNHDIWMKGYFEEELKIPVYHHPVSVKLDDKIVLIGHGDGLGPKDHGYKAMKALFTNRVCQWLFRQIHPDFGIRIANFWSKKSRASQDDDKMQFMGAEKEWLVQFCQAVLQKEHYDYFVFGHRHLPIEHELSSKSTYINLGDWLQHRSYGDFISGKISLKYYD